jgi:hypothetical protein
MMITFVIDFGLRLGSMGFTPIYDGLKTPWIMTIHDETVNTSREVICDAQSMTKWNFVIDAVLWWKLDDPWWKSTVIDHKVFCSDHIIALINVTTIYIYIEWVLCYLNFGKLVDPFFVCLLVFSLFICVFREKYEAWSILILNLWLVNLG